MTNNLKELIYKYNNIIVTESETVESIVNEIEAIRQGSSIDGYIFRPAFANSVEFTEYTNEDYYAIYAQWSLSFGWSGIFELFTGDNPEDILNNYLSESMVSKFEPLITEEKAPIVKRIDYLPELTKTLMESKTVLTSHQKDILINMPIEMLKRVYNEANITIREIRTLVVTEILKIDKTFNPFNTISDIIPILIENYSIKNTFVLEAGEMLNKKILKEVKIKVPTSIRRKVLETLKANYKTTTAKENFKKYQDFWKKVLRQVLISNSFEKTVNQYPEIKDIYELIYSNISTTKTKVEAYKKQGLLEEAFTVEMNNMGNLFRSILFYLRNEKGSTYPIKMDNKPTEKQIKVQTDISNIIKTKEFKDALTKTNPKLLLQVKALLNDVKYSKPQLLKVCNNKRVHYEKEIPAINGKWAKKIIKSIEKAYSKIKKEANKELGKVFVSDYFDDIRVNFSGRIDVSTNTSGKFLPIGSKIKIDKILEEGTILRYGVSWKSPKTDPHLSICIDPSLHITNGKHKGHVVNWQMDNHTLKEGNEILMSSSGDVTQCTQNKWSTELIDIDTEAMRKAESTEMFTAVINYDSAEKGSLGEVETHIFVNVIDRKDRVISGRKISIPLDQMDYSYKIDENSQAQIGLKFDLKEGTIEVLKIAEGNIHSNSTGTQLHDRFVESIENKPMLPTVKDNLISSIKKKQMVTSIEDADLVIDQNTDINTIQNIIF